jgi:hypothetical protein
MSLLSRFNSAVQDYSNKLATSGRDAHSSPIERTLIELAPVIEQATTEFTAIRMGQTDVPNSAVFLLDSKSTLVRSMLIFDTESKKFFRRDELDLNVPDLMFELTNQTREENVETHDFSYDTEEEVVEAYLQWFAWAVAVLRKEKADESTSDGRAQSEK